MMKMTPHVCNWTWTQTSVIYPHLSLFLLFLLLLSSCAAAVTTTQTGKTVCGSREQIMHVLFLTAAVKLLMTSVVSGTIHPTSTMWRWEDLSIWFWSLAQLAKKKKITSSLLSHTYREAASWNWRVLHSVSCIFLVQWALGLHFFR